LGGSKIWTPNMGGACALGAAQHQGSICRSYYTPTASHVNSQLIRRRIGPVICPTSYTRTGVNGGSQRL